MKILKSGNILKVDASSHNAIIYDSLLNETSTFKGEPLFDSWMSMSGHYAQRTNSDYTGEETGILWMNGNYSVAVLDESTGKTRSIDSFWSMQDGSMSFGCLCVTSPIH